MEEVGALFGVDRETEREQSKEISPTVLFGMSIVVQ